MRVPAFHLQPHQFVSILSDVPYLHPDDKLLYSALAGHIPIQGIRVAGKGVIAHTPTFVPLFAGSWRLSKLLHSVLPKSWEYRLRERIFRNYGMLLNKRLIRVTESNAAEFRELAQVKPDRDLRRLRTSERQLLGFMLAKRHTSDYILFNKFGCDDKGTDTIYDVAKDTLREKALIEVVYKVKKLEVNVTRYFPGTTALVKPFVI